MLVDGLSDHRCYSRDLGMLQVLMKSSCVPPVWGFPGGSVVKNPPAIQETWF